MANCKNCAAPLPTNSTICKYCHTRNDIDLKGQTYKVKIPTSERICPRCDIPLQTIDLKLEGGFFIERCSDCMGFFFDPGELETLLETSVADVFHINPEQLENLNKNKRHDDYPVTYIKCPVCRKFMQRLNYGSQSGVIVDQCKNDGVWLDGGELRHLMEWIKAGGKILDQQTNAEKERIRKLQEAQKAKDAAINAAAASYGPSEGYMGLGRYESRYGNDPEDLLGLITNMVSRLFRF